MNELKYISEFREALSNYHASKESLDSIANVELVLLVAATASGRNTIIRELVKTGKYRFLISDTTRTPRVNNGVLERNGVEYWFRTEEDMLHDIQAGKFLEAAIIHNQQVSGMSIKEIRKALEDDKIAINDIEIAGADNAVKQKPDTLAIFVLPPSFEEWQNRIKQRGHMDEQEYKRRMKSAVYEFKHALNNEYYKFIINDTIESSVYQINKIAIDNIVDADRQATIRELATEICSATEQLLNKL
jgi:guanylate kinase